MLAVSPAGRPDIMRNAVTWGHMFLTVQEKYLMRATYAFALLQLQRCERMRLGSLGITTYIHRLLQHEVWKGLDLNTYTCAWELLKRACLLNQTYTFVLCAQMRSTLDASSMAS